MSVALIHYHLRPGGVTRVIEAQSEALSRAGIAHVILSGTAYEGSARLPVTVVPSLDYHKDYGREGADISQLFSGLRQAADQALNSEPACWHLHNPTLGKNALFPGLVAELAGSRVPLVLHLHDLAEDGRPENYENLVTHEHLYPLAPQIRYLTLNPRDQAILLASGVPPKQISLLPNAIQAPTEFPRPTREPDAPFVFYAVRGIRRKNLGEFCLLSALAPPGTSFALALAPDNPIAPHPPRPKRRVQLRSRAPVSSPQRGFVAPQGANPENGGSGPRSPRPYRLPSGRLGPLHPARMHHRG